MRQHKQLARQIVLAAIDKEDMTMEVSEVRLTLLKTENAVRAIGSFALDNQFAVRGVRIMEDKNGHNFVAFPSREKADGTYEDIAFPLSKELYATITGAILDEYKKQVEKQSQEQTKEQEQEQTQTEAKSEAAPAPKKGRSR